MSTWSEDFAYALDTLDEPHPADLSFEAITETISDLAEAIEVSGEAATITGLLETAAITDIVAAAAGLKASYYLGVLIGAGIYASAHQAWEPFVAPIDMSKVYDVYFNQVPIIELPVTEDASGPDLHVESDDAPPYPGYVLLKGTSDTGSTRLIQKRLTALGYPNVEVDGIYGKHTYTGVHKFQENHNLYVDGKVGEDTWKALFGT